MKTSNYSAIDFNIVLFGSILIYALFQASIFATSYYIGDDFPQHLLWLYEYEPNYFQADDFYLHSSHVIQPWGIQVVNTALVQVFSPLFISRAMPFVLLIVLCGYAYFLAVKYMDRKFAVTFMVLIALFSIDRLTGFFARAYAYPLLMAFMYYWVCGKKGGQFISLILSALFYPIVFLIEVGLIGIQTIANVLQNKKSLVLNSLLPIAIAIVIGSVIIIFKSQELKQSKWIGDFLSQSQILTLPEFKTGGRVDFHRSMPVQFNVDSIVNHRIWSIIYSLLCAGMAVLLYWFTSKIRQNKYFVSIDTAFVWLCFSGIAWFCAAHWFMPQLFIPQRYILYALMPVAIWLVVRLAWKYFQKSNFQTVAVTALIVIAFIVQWSNVPFYRDYNKYKALYEQINHIKQASVFAGMPAIMDHIPTFCQQSVLVSGESVHALYFEHYYNYISPRMKDLVSAYTATSPQKLVSFVNKYDIDYLVVEKKYIEYKKAWLFQPYKDIVRSKLSEMEASDLYFNKVPEEWIIPVNEDCFILDCKYLR